MSVITEEHFQKMIKLMDKDGDGTVSKEEFKVAYNQAAPDGPVTDDLYDQVWSKIDADGDGNLTVEELAKYYGFKLGTDGMAAGTDEMNDDAILEALAMAAALDVKAEIAKQDSEDKEKAAEKKEMKRDLTLIQINSSELKKNKDPDAVKQMVKLDEALLLSDLKPKDGDPPDEICDVKSLIEAGCILRYVNEKGEMPLHRLAKIVPTEKNMVTYKEVFNLMITEQKRQAEKAGRTLYADVNHQDKQNKTPLFVAVEAKNGKCMDMLFALGKDGPDPMLVNSEGWTVLHAACHAGETDGVKRLFNHLSVGRKKVLIDTSDKQGRQPLHICAYRDEEGELCKFLIQQGAKNATKDAAGNVPSEVAVRANRRKSKDIIEEETHTAQVVNKERRKSRDSKETLYAVAPAAAEAGGMGGGMGGS